MFLWLMLIFHVGYRLTVEYSTLKKSVISSLLMIPDHQHDWPWPKMSVQMGYWGCPLIFIIPPPPKLLPYRRCLPLVFSSISVTVCSTGLQIGLKSGRNLSSILSSQAAWTSAAHLNLFVCQFVQLYIETYLKVVLWGWVS